jgi:hypothetical protein
MLFSTILKRSSLNIYRDGVKEMYWEEWGILFMPDALFKFYGVRGADAPELLHLFSPWWVRPVKMTVPWDAALCSLLDGYQGFEGTCCLRPEGGN